MLPNIQVRYRLGLVLFLVATVIIATLPSPPVVAQEVGEIQFLDNTQGEFASGIFERTAVGPFVNSTIPSDQEGAVQLAPAGILTRWGAGVNLPTQAVSNGGLVGLDRFLYLVGGELNNGKSDKVFRATIDTATGRPVPYDVESGLVWREFTMPAAEANGLPSCQGFTGSARSRNSAAALQATAGANLGYIYVVGGVFDLDCGSDLTSPLVQIATVDSGGEIVAWRNAPFMPTALTSGALNTATPLGIADAMVTIVRTSTNRYFLYVIGGVAVNPDSPNPNRIYKSVIYTQINSESGAIAHPLTGDAVQPWARAADMEFYITDAAKTGLRDGTAMAARASKLDTTSDPPIVVTNDAIFIAGGCFTALECFDNNSAILRADITNPDTGEIIWDPTPSEGDSEVAFEGRNGLGGVVYNNKIYLIGGSVDGTALNAKNSVPTAFYDENLNVLRLGDGDTFFIGPNEPVLPQAGGDTGARTDLSATLIPATPPPGDTAVANAAWVYVIGGRNVDGTNTNTLTIGRVGGDDEADDTRRTRDGWYYSSIESIRIAGRTARVLTLRWTADIDRSSNSLADVRIEFRKAITAAGCSESDFDSSTASTNPERWRVLDGDPASTFFSKTNSGSDQFNIVKMSDVFGDEQVDATCLQFRAYLMQNGPDTQVAPLTPSATPRILSLSLEKIVAGSPDLKLEDIEDGSEGFSIITSGGSLRDIKIRLKNLNSKGLEDTLAVDEMTNDGSFFVNLCVAYAPLNQPEPTLTLPEPGVNADIPSCSVAYAEVPNRFMGKGTVLALSELPLWRPNPESTNTEKRLLDELNLFNEPGRYRVGLIIDFNNLIPEGTDGEENNRGESVEFPNGKTILITITAPPSTQISLPLLAK